MKLKVLLPTEVLVDTEVSKIIAEAGNGFFCLLPEHADFLAALPPGLFSYVPEDKGEQFLAVDRGILVKYGEQVLVSARNAVRGEDLESLRQTVRRQFEALDERERKTQTALAKIEADFVRRFLEFGKHG